MDPKSPEKLSMDPPVYSFLPKSVEGRKSWALILLLLLVLILIVIGSALIGVYLTQKHTERMVAMAFNSMDGEEVTQTVFVDELENVAVIFVNTNNHSAAVLYDYRRNLIAFKEPDSRKCFVTGMDRETPSASAVISAAESFHTHDAPADNVLSYNLMEKEAADPAELGIGINILCRDLPVYWAQPVNPNLRKITIKFKVFGLKFKVTIEK
ncbi:pulmonary surfactant-associated protein C-like [Spea bombifrons]|uniref:pulmonary surfactant-associated protein C-like n=1 Tax=Spea bombifrons TaxID=233779 RepID=UPI00234BC8A5|nr:pulmonary surfactant-associated protein C-like [Spea bombifrons]